ncbi:MAG: 23S rRNA (uracil(1939)-C(5))-methyltransferase RlmD [Bacteroidota bacterium]
MRKKKIFENIEIEEFAAEGKTLAHVDGKVIFIKGGAPGDVVDVRVTNKRKSFFEGVPLKFHKYSSIRIDPSCEHFGTCGGCKWQHVPYETQLSFKQQQVIDNFERLGKFEIPESKPIMGSVEEEFYRNKLEYTFSDSRWLTQEEIDTGVELERNALGFHIPGRFDKILNIEKCYLQPEPSNKIRNWVREYALENNISFFNIREQVGFLRNLIIRTSTLGQTMVILQVHEDKPELTEPLLSKLNDDFDITSLNYVVNTKKNETFSDLEIINFSGKPFIEEKMSLNGTKESLTFRIGPKSFYQTNSKQAEQLYRRVSELAQIKADDTVYDLYTGTGTIANFIAHQAQKVVGLEYVPEAIEDAKVNSEINNITNTEFFAGDIKDLLNRDFIDNHGKPDVIITDPPRAGMHPSVVRMLNEVKANKIVYVSCNPATQARDISELSELYNVVEFQPVDMFPHTHHVENIVLLNLK